MTYNVVFVERAAVVAVYCILAAGTLFGYPAGDALLELVKIWACCWDGASEGACEGDEG